MEMQGDTTCCMHRSWLTKLQTKTEDRKKEKIYNYITQDIQNIPF